MSVIERTREIGMLRALGWGRARVLWMIVGEGFCVSLVGGCLGLGLGTNVTAHRVATQPKLAADRLDTLPLAISHLDLHITLLT